jgi:hypothetical protein
MTFSLSLNFIVFFCTWSEGDKLYWLESDSDLSSEDNRASQSLLLLTCLQRLQSFICFWAKFLFRSKSWLSGWFFFISCFQLLTCFRCSYICSESWSFKTKTWFNNLNLILWSCTLEYILPYSIVLLYFVIIKTLLHFVIIKTSEALYKTHFGSTVYINFWRSQIILPKLTLKRIEPETLREVYSKVLNQHHNMHKF